VDDGADRRRIVVARPRKWLAIPFGRPTPPDTAPTTTGFVESII
jgi:hypothetical protein